MINGFAQCATEIELIVDAGEANRREARKNVREVGTRVKIPISWGEPMLKNFGDKNFEPQGRNF